MNFLRTTILIPVLMLGLAATAHACPGCKEALASGDGPQGDIVSGYFWSILFMMSMPFTILGTFGIVVYRAMRKAQAQQNIKSGDAEQTGARVMHSARQPQHRETVGA